MDEATSALDPPSQERPIKLIRKNPPELTIISVGHRPEREAFHERKLVLESRQDGAKLVREIEFPPVETARRTRKRASARRAAE